MKKILIVVLSVFMYSHLLKAQVKPPVITPEQFSDAQGRTTLIILLHEDPKKTIKLKKAPSELEAYQRDIKEYNERIQAVAEEFWKFTTKYEFVTLPEAIKMSKGKLAKDFAILQYNEVSKAAPTAAATIVNSTLPYKKLSTPADYGCFEFRIVENLAPQKPAFATAIFTFQAPKEADMIFGLHILQFNLSNGVEGALPKDLLTNLQNNGKNLQGKTLLINKSDIIEESFDQEKFKKLYPFDWMIDHPDSIAIILQEKNPDYVYVMICPTANNMLQHYLVSCEDGVVCAIYETRYDEKAVRKQRINDAALRGYSKYAK
jgi:hypothetical protein